jgi:hypothetical protein
MGTPCGWRLLVATPRTSRSAGPRLAMPGSNIGAEQTLIHLAVAVAGSCEGRCQPIFERQRCFFALSCHDIRGCSHPGLMRQAWQSCFPPLVWSALVLLSVRSTARQRFQPIGQQNSFAITSRPVTGSRASSSRTRRRRATYRDRSDDSSFPRPCSWSYPQRRNVLVFGSEHRNRHVANPVPSFPTRIQSHPFTLARASTFSPSLSCPVTSVP